MSSYLSPDAAAARANVSRRTIMRAVQELEIKGYRDNRNRWRIDAASLDAWIAERPPSGMPEATPGDTPGNAGRDALYVQLQNELAAARVENATLVAKIAAVQDQLSAVERLYTERLEAEQARREDVERDRDAWRGLAERAAASWWSRLIEAWRKP